MAQGEQSHSVCGRHTGISFPDGILDSFRATVIKVNLSMRL